MSSEQSSIQSSADKKFKPVEIKVFRNTTRDIGFDLFLKLGPDNYAHVFSRVTGLDYKRLAQYIFKGIKELYIKVEDETVYNDFISVTTDSILGNPNVATEKKLATLLNMTEQNMAELFMQVNVNEATAQKTQQVVKNYVQILCDSPKTLATLLKLVAHGEYLYYHSIATSIFSMFISKATGQFNQKFMEIVGLGGFLHDIGCTQLPQEITNSAVELSSAQWKEMRQHPRLGLQMLEGTQGIPDEVRFIVYQHHEKCDGHGYPNGLLSSAIYYPAKIVSVADAFSALISKRPFRSAYTVEQAIKILQSEAGKFDREIVRLLPAIFLRQAPSDEKAAA